MFCVKLVGTAEIIAMQLEHQYFYYFTIMFAVDSTNDPTQR